MNLFQTGYFTLHAGGFSNFKIDCDALTDGDIRSIGLQLAQRLPDFGTVEGIPSGGLRLAEAMKKYIVLGSEVVLIVDDVYTTGTSIEAQRDYRLDVIGAVIFARVKTPAWITPLFILNS